MQKREVVVITGASTALGRAAVREFARHGADVALIACDHEGLEAAAREVEAFGGQALRLLVDVSAPEQLHHAAERVEDELGPIDVWVNNARMPFLSGIEDPPRYEDDCMPDDTYVGYVYGTLAALKFMLPRDRGVIVQVDSALAHSVSHAQTSDGGTSDVILDFFSALRTELIHDSSNVHATVVQIPTFHASRSDWLRAGLPRETKLPADFGSSEIVARMVHFAAHHPERREWIASGPVLKTIFGVKTLPSGADRSMAPSHVEARPSGGEVAPDREERSKKRTGVAAAVNEPASSRSLRGWAKRNAGVVAFLLGLGIARAVIGTRAKK